MKFDTVETSKPLPTKGVKNLHFRLVELDPLVHYFHFVDRKIVDCKGGKCQVCADANRKFQAAKTEHEKREALPLFKKTRYSLPVEVATIADGVEPGIYIWSFAKNIFNAYQYLTKHAERYEWMEAGSGTALKPMSFTLRTTHEGSFPSYDASTFEFGDKIISIARLRKDSEILTWENTFTKEKQ
jgi:hypothetical protein